MSQIISLNVGGIVFQTTKSTIAKYPGFLKTLLETDVPITRDSNDVIFIDRDPRHFHVVLNFLRDGDVDFPNDKQIIKEIKKESEFYLLDGLIKKCQEALISFEDIRIIDNLKGIRDVVMKSKKLVIVVTFALKDNYTLYWPAEKSKFESLVRKFEPRAEIFFMKSDYINAIEKKAWSVFYYTEELKQVTMKFQNIEDLEKKILEWLDADERYN